MEEFTRKKEKYTSGSTEYILVAILLVILYDFFE